MDESAHNSTAKSSGIGPPVRRREDLRLVRGGGRYTADENLPDQVYAVMLRSPHAHARIRSIDTAKAKAVPGVLAVLTGADVLADGLKPVPHKPWSPHPAETTLRNKSGEPPFEPPHWPLPTDKARFVGEAVAMVVGETVYAAKNGAEAIEIDYEVLPAVVETAAAARQDAPHRPRRRPLQCLLRCRARRRSRDRSGLRPRRPCDPVRDLGAARHRRADGAARRACRLRRRDRPLHGLCRQRRRGAAEDRSRHDARRDAGKSARADAGRRRQFRHPRHDLCRNSRWSPGRRKSSAGR